METENALVVKLKKDVIEWLANCLSLPLRNNQTRQALLYSAGLAPLCDSLSFEDTTAAFIPSLVEGCFAYGSLPDGQHAMAAVLNAGRAWVGKEGQEACDTLLNRIRQAAPFLKKPPMPIPDDVTKQEVESIQKEIPIEKQVYEWLTSEEDRLINHAIEAASQDYEAEISQNDFFKNDLRVRLDWIRERFYWQTDTISLKDSLRPEDPLVLAQPYNKALESIAEHIEQARESNRLSQAAAEKLLRDVRALKNLESS